MAEGRARIGMDAGGVVTSFDEGAEMLFGFRGADVLGRTVAELIVPPELHSAHNRGIARVAGGGHSVLTGSTVEVPALDAYGRRLLVELTITEAGKDEAPTRFVGTISVVGAHGATDRPSSAER